MNIGVMLLSCLISISYTNHSLPAVNHSHTCVNYSTPAGNRSTPAWNRFTPAGNRPTPAGNRSTPAGNRSTPAENRHTPAGNRSHTYPNRSSRRAVPRITFLVFRVRFSSLFQEQILFLSVAQPLAVCNLLITLGLLLYLLILSYYEL